MPEARTGLARELATNSETRSSSLKDVFIGRTAENREERHFRAWLFSSP